MASLGLVRRCVAARVLYVVSFLDMLGVSMIIPSLPQYVRSLDGGVLVFGLLMSLYGFIQFFAAPVVGSLSDHYSRKRVLLACFVGTSTGYLLLGLSWNIYVVLLSRVPAALFKHTLDVIKVAATDGKQADRRSAAIGRLNAAANAGFIVGPVVGGYVSSIPNGFQLPDAADDGALRSQLLPCVTLLSGPTHPHSDHCCGQERAPSGGLETLASQRVDQDARLQGNRQRVQTDSDSACGQAAAVHGGDSVPDALFSATGGQVCHGFERPRICAELHGLLGFCGSFSVGFVTKQMKSERLVLKLCPESKRWQPSRNPACWFCRAIAAQLRAEQQREDELAALSQLRRDGRSVTQP